VIDEIMSRTAADLPEDPAELRRFAAALAAEVHAKTLLIEKLKMQLAILRRARFGRSSERLDRDIDLRDEGGRPMIGQEALPLLELDSAASTFKCPQCGAELTS